MSLSDSERLAAFAMQAGFEVQPGDGTVAACGVPCLVQYGAVGACMIETSCDPDCKPTADVGSAVHAVRVTLDGAHDGRVYHANGDGIGNFLDGDGKTWSNISIKKGGQGSAEDDASAYELVHRYAKQIVGAVAAAGHTETAFIAKRGPFKIPNTFEARAAVGPMQDRIRGQRIAIIGLGGTGSYVLDLMAKTPVADIHLLDSDKMDWHNYMRAPGAPVCREIESQIKEPPLKVHYYQAKYASLRDGVHAHEVRVDDPDVFAEFISAHPVDFAFVCIDQDRDGALPRQDAVYTSLSKANVPFIDSGVSITLSDDQVAGAVTTSAYDGGSAKWKERIPNARVNGDAPGYRNVQLPEVNALAASLAVMEWRRRTGQYVTDTATSPLHKFRLESAKVRHVK
ncbi:MAG: hypothetical protein F4220_13050 [Gammaproteobacteria bacterium]|nr:hypothetical protein [Gammaproteobacteria bacterium]MYH16554.1 hypothetical protein [Gammaproteobacteria bacterium]MYK81890.1 hypothetical protein [Gammaproteobacteria bacterium]